MRLGLAAVVALLAACGAPADEPASGSTSGQFIAFNRDFNDFRAWPRVSLGRFTAGGHLEGPVQYAYVSAPRDPATGRFPRGARIVRSLEDGDPTRWGLFAMAKRGGGYNAAGASGWEFFRLVIDAAGEVQIVSRGLNATQAGDPYDIGEGTGCNTCHGLEDARPYDSILSPALRPPDEP